MKRALAWIWFLLLAALLFFGASFIAAKATPEELAFFLGLFGFFLLANPLIFGYAALLNFLGDVARGHAKAETAYKALGTPQELQDEKAVLTLAVLWFNQLAPYRYAYYGFFLLLLLIALAPQLAGPAFGWGGVLIGLMWGAAVPTVVVFGLEIAAGWQLAGLLRIEEESSSSKTA